MWITSGPSYYDVCFCFQFDSLNTLSLTNIDKGMWHNLYAKKDFIVSYCCVTIEQQLRFVIQRTLYVLTVSGI